MRSKLILQTISVVLITLWILWIFLWYNYIRAIVYIVVWIALYLFTIYIYNKFYNITLKYIDPYIPREKRYEQTEFLKSEEIVFYKTLYKVLHNEYWDRYHIFSQVELQQLFQKKNESAFRLNMSIDFLIVDFEKDLNPIIAIELDWDPHKNNKKVQYNDLKKEHLFSLSRIQLIHIDDEYKDNEDKIYEEIIPVIESKRIKKS